MSDDSDKKLLVATALFAVRVFRAPPPTAIREFQAVDQPRILAAESMDRAELAERCALDAAAIMAAVDKLS
jgi:hypothetical protein